MAKSRCYTELSKLTTFEERFRYLMLNGNVAEDTFGFDRYLNQAFYRSKEWKRVRNIVIMRDGGCDLGIDGLYIHDRIIIHHMNPITMKDIIQRNPKILDPEYLISVSHKTHNGITYGDDSVLECYNIVDRKPNDTTPWK